MIPKILHYVWVGGAPKPDLVKRCVDSWSEHCPDYKVMEWNDDSLKSIHNMYVRQAYDNRKWAFVSDYLRLHALFKYGGIYVDSDLEITARLDKFLQASFFTGYENWKGNISPITALMGAEPGNRIIKGLLDEYEDLPFIKDGVMDQKTNTSRITEYFSKEFGLNGPYDGGNTLKLGKGAYIYPSFFFCTPEIGKENYSIHHFNGSWLDGYERVNLFSTNSIKFVRFKKRFDISKNTLPISQRERVLFLKKLSDKYVFAIIWSKK